MMSGSPILNRTVEYVSQLEACGLLEQFGGMYRFQVSYCNTRDRTKLVELSQKLREYGYLRREKEDMAVTPEEKVIPLRNVPIDVVPVNNSLMAPPREEWASLFEARGWRFKPGVLGQLPPKIRTVQFVPLLNRKRYSQAEKKFIEFLAEYYNGDYGRVNKTLRGQAMTQIQILKHLAEQGKVPSVIKWLENFMEDTGDQKMILFCGFRDCQESYMDRFRDDPKVNAAEIRGDQTPEIRQANIDRFQNDDNCRLIICMIQAGGIGITLTAAHHMAFTGLGWGPATHDQAEDRAWGRMNDLHGLSVYYLLSEKTIEAQISSLIDQKREIVTAATAGAEAEEEAMLAQLMEHYASSYAMSAVLFGSEEADDDD
jgi:SNF2 family DNA or RNA helicase